MTNEKQKGSPVIWRYKPLKGILFIYLKTRGLGLVLAIAVASSSPMVKIFPLFGKWNCRSIVGAWAFRLLVYLYCSSCQFLREWPLSPTGGLTPWIVDRRRLNEPGSPYSSFATLPDWSSGVKLLLMLLMAIGIVAERYFKVLSIDDFVFGCPRDFCFLHSIFK